MILPPLGVPGGGIVLLLFFVHFVDPDKEQPVVFVSLLFYPGGESAQGKKDLDGIGCPDIFYLIHKVVIFIFPESLIFEFTFSDKDYILIKGAKNINLYMLYLVVVFYSGLIFT